MQLRLIFCALVISTVAPMLFAADTLTCPVTTPATPAFVPPTPYPPTPPVGMFWYGSRALWTRLPNGATWNSDAVSDKLFLWQQGYDGTADPKPDIAVAIKRLIDPYPDVEPLNYGTNASVDGNWTMLTTLAIPATGCWEVTVTHVNAKLTFVVLVQPRTR